MIDRINKIGYNKLYPILFFVYKSLEPYLFIKTYL